MEIIRKITRDGNYNTVLYSLLKNISEIQCFNAEHNLRKPLAIYNVAFLKIMHNANAFLDLIINDNKDAKETYRSFLESVNEFVDNGYNIIKCYYPKSASSSTTVFADKWLESINQKGIKEYKASIQSYIKDTKYIVNKIKHDGGRLEQVFIKTIFGTCSGYFLERFNNDVLEPDENVHKKYKQQHTAFSYITDLMRNLSSVYIISEEITKYFEKYILPSNFNYSEPVTDNDCVYNVIKKLWKLPMVLFPNEYGNGMTIVDINDFKKELIIKYPASNFYTNKFNRYSKFRVELLTSGDGESKSFQLPYWNL